MENFTFLVDYICVINLMVNVVVVCFAEDRKITIIEAFITFFIIKLFFMSIILP